VKFCNFNKINEYRNFGGLRNEEDILITKTSLRVHGKPMPKIGESFKSMPGGGFLVM
jgi:Xaa-Pro aminopeptidase